MYLGILLIRIKAYAWRPRPAAERSGEPVRTMVMKHHKSQATTSTKTSQTAWYPTITIAATIRSNRCNLDYYGMVHTTYN